MLDQAIIIPFFSGVPWMAPEVMQANGYGKQADIWSLGCVIIEMATANHPWESFDNNIAAMVRIAMSNDMPPLPEELSETAKDFITQCLTRSPKH